MEKIQINKLKKKLLFVKMREQPQIILSHVVKNKINFDAILEDPAKSLFKKKLKNIQTYL